MFRIKWLAALIFTYLLKTGSGKTYTMGTNHNGDESSGGIIPKVMETIFHCVETMKDSAEFLIRVSFIEVIVSFTLLDGIYIPTWILI